MKGINKFHGLLIAAIMAVSVIFSACNEENITKDTYSFPDVYVALIRVTPAEIVPLSDMMIEGNDLDHVKTVRIWNGEGQLDIPKSNFKEHTKSVIVVNVPENAPLGVDDEGKPKGRVSVITNEDKIITWLRNVSDRFIVISDVSPLTVAIGEVITLQGENLEFVKAVRLSKGNDNLIIPKEEFQSFSADDGTIEILLPEGAPVEKLALISDYDQMIVWDGSLTERMLTVESLSPASGSDILQRSTVAAVIINPDLLKGVRFGTESLDYEIEEDEDEGTITLKFVVPMYDEGTYKLFFNTNNGEVEVASYYVRTLNYIFFDFDEKGSWWGDCPQTVEDDPAYSISGKYFHAKATAAAGWYGLFWRNAGNGLNLYNVNVEEWSVRYDINVLGDDITSIKIRLGDFWYVTGINPNMGGWYTIIAPLRHFKDNNGNGNPMTNADLEALASSGDFGLADGGAGGEYDALFDNVRFEKVPNPDYVYFDFDGKGSWWGDCPQTVEDDPDYSISGKYFHIEATAAADWYGLFWRNAGNGLNVTGVTVNDWVVKYDINVLGPDITSFKIRLGDFWYITGVNPNIGGWYTFTAPLNDFKDNDGKGNPMTDADVAALASAGDFGFADGGAGGEYDVLIDNVRFEPK